MRLACSFADETLEFRCQRTEGSDDSKGRDWRFEMLHYPLAKEGERPKRERHNCSALHLAKRERQR